MNRHTPTTCLLLAATLFYLGGAMGFVHERFAHGRTTVVAQADHGHDERHDQPAPLQPRDHHDCPTCVVISHVAASTLDLSTPPTLLSSVERVSMTPSRVIVSNDSIHLPDNRGPPRVHF